MLVDVLSGPSQGGHLLPIQKTTPVSVDSWCVRWDGGGVVVAVTFLWFNQRFGATSAPLGVTMGETYKIIIKYNCEITTNL